MRPDLTFRQKISRFMPSALMNHAIALYIALDIWLFHKAPQITDYLKRITP